MKTRKSTILRGAEKMKTRTVAIILFLMAGSIFAKTPQLYIGSKAGLGPVFGSDGTVLGGNLNPIQFNWQMTNLLALETGMGFYFGPETKYTAPKQTDPDSGIMETYSGMETHMVFPLLLKATLKLTNIFLLEFGGGLYISPVLMNTRVERTNENGYTVAEGYGKNLFSANHNPFGFIASSSLGVKIFNGVIFLDIGYLRDFTKVTVKFNDKDIGNHIWKMLAINIGYKHGFLYK